MKLPSSFILSSACVLAATGCVGVYPPGSVQQKDVPGVYILQEGQGVELLYLNPDNSFRQVIVEYPQAPVEENKGKWKCYPDAPAFPTHVFLDEAIHYRQPYFSGRELMGLGLPIHYVGDTLVLDVPEVGHRTFSRIGNLVGPKQGK